MSYLALNLVVLAGVAVVSALLGRGLWRLILIVFAVLAVLTVIFDSIMIGADLFRFSPDKLAGVYLWRAPIEDLAWPLAAAMLLPSLWWRLGRRPNDSPVPQRSAGERSDAP